MEGHSIQETKFFHMFGPGRPFSYHDVTDPDSTHSLYRVLAYIASQVSQT